ncbi:MAG: M20/M25/M40 family metallo-hydrolase [Coriobacteriales bacterium]|jgi:tripeptide aminopeptidase|nr:M20/M25/M40 family metallo-hydrolase [Coriobacteriales bacterium]
MNAERLLDTFLDLVRIDSPSLAEANVAAYCKQALEQAGCVVRFDDTTSVTGSNTGNLIATLPANPLPTTPPPKRYFSAHMDCVNPCEGIKPVIADGIIRSSGDTILSGDDRVGLAAIIELIRTLAEEDRPHPEIGVLFSVGEEIGLRGAYALDSNDFVGEPCFVLDANGSPGVVIIGAPFRYLFTARFTGKASHAGIEPERGISAIALASKAVLAMQLGRLDEYTTANVGTISGGSAFNVVPETCTVTGEFRAMDERRTGEVKAQLTAAFEGAVRDSGGSVEVDWDEEYPGFQIRENDPLVQLVLDEATALGLPAQTVITGGGSDANILASKGLRALVLGTGMTDVHSTTESLAITDLESLTRLCIALATAWE